MTQLHRDPLFAGIDLGTSGCRLIVIDSQDSVAADHRIHYGQGEKQTPDLWWKCVCKLFTDLPVKLRESLAALAIDGTSGTVLLADDKGEPCSEALMYHDLRATRQAEQLAGILAEENGAQGASSSLARALWLWQELDESTRQSCSHILNQADYISGKLLDRFGLSDENNCLKLGYDVVHRQWPQQLHSLELPEKLYPEVVPAGSLLGNITGSVAQKLGLPERLQIIAGTTDSIAAFIATGAAQPGEAVTSLGSTLVLKLITRTPIFAPRYGIYSHRLNPLNGRQATLKNRNETESIWLVGGASNSGGNVLLQHFSQQQLDQLTPLLHPEKLLDLGFYPLVKPGERFPHADPDWKPNLEPRPVPDEDFLQALLEGIADIEATGYQMLQSLGANALENVRTVGGGSVNPAWSEIRRKKLKVPVFTSSQTEAAHGCALLAARGYETG